MTESIVDTASPALLPWECRIPAALLYWGVAPVSVVTGPAVSHVERYALERWLPVDTDHLHMVAAQAVTGERVMIGIEPERLRRWLAEQPVSWPQIWDLVPDRLPPGVPALVATARWSLLVGEFEPAARRSARTQIRWGLISAALVIALLAVIGTERTVAWANREARRISDETAARIVEAFPPGPGDASTPSERLLMAVRQSAANRAGASRGTAPRLLQKLLAALPAQIRLQAEVLSVTEERVNFRVRVPDLAAAEAVHQAWQALAPEVHMRAEAMQAQSQDGVATAVITLVREAP